MEEGMQLYQPGTAVPDWTLRGLRWQGAQILRPDTQVHQPWKRGCCFPCLAHQGLVGPGESSH